MGSSTGSGATSATYSNFLGREAGYGATGGSYSNFLGPYSGWNATGATHSNFFGYYAGLSAATASNSIFIGQKSGNGDAVDNTGSVHNWSILLGYNNSTGGYSNSVLIGGATSATAIANTKANEFMLAPSLLYLNARGVPYEWPSAQATAAGQVLGNDGSGVLSWITNGAGGGGGTVTSVSSATTNQLTVANPTTTPALTVVTGAVSNGATNLSTADQVYDFVTGQGYLTSVTAHNLLSATHGDALAGSVAAGVSFFLKN